MSDLHLSHTPPLARSKEENWYGCMQRVLEEIGEIANVKDRRGQPGWKVAPVVYAGDIFHVWNPPPELINFALKYLPSGFAVPGQHDLPNHRYEDMERSAYWTLVEGGRIDHLDDDLCEGGVGPRQKQEDLPTLRLSGFPWGKEPQPITKRSSLVRSVAVIHAYCWRKGCSYPDAPRKQRVKSWGEKLKGYDYAFFGDNHIPFTWKSGDLTLVNCGSLMRRNIDQLDHKPKAWLLLSDGRVISHELDTSKDVMYDGRDHSEVKIAGQSLTDFIGRLKELRGQVLDFEDVVLRYLDKYEVEEGVRKVILTALEESK